MVKVSAKSPVTGQDGEPNVERRPSYCSPADINNHLSLTPSSSSLPTLQFSLLSRYLRSSHPPSRHQLLWLFQSPRQSTNSKSLWLLGTSRGRWIFLRRSTSQSRRWISRRTFETIETLGIQLSSLRFHLGGIGT